MQRGCASLIEPDGRGGFRDAATQAEAVRAVEDATGPQKATQAPAVGPAFNPKEMDAWGQDIADLDQGFYDSSVSRSIDVALNGGSLDSVAHALAKSAGMDPAQAAELVNEGTAMYQRAFEHADKGLWFVGRDVCRSLGLPVEKSGSYNNHLSGLGGENVVNASSLGVVGLGKGMWAALLLNEQALYTLVMRSRKPEAAALKDWVTGSVLPTIRKTGGYMTPTVAEMAITDPTEFLARAMVIALR